MPNKSTTAELSFSDLGYAKLEDYLAEVRRLLLGKQLPARWVDELISLDNVYLKKCFEKPEPPVFAAFEIYITEEESAREPVQADQRLKIHVYEQATHHLQRLVELGLWGSSVEEVGKSLIVQALAAKLESGLLRTPPRK